MRYFNITLVRVREYILGIPNSNSGTPHHPPSPPRCRLSSGKADQAKANHAHLRQANGKSIISPGRNHGTFHPNADHFCRGRHADVAGVADPADVRRTPASAPRAPENANR